MSCVCGPFHMCVNQIVVCCVLVYVCMICVTKWSVYACGDVLWVCCMRCMKQIVCVDVCVYCVSVSCDVCCVCVCVCVHCVYVCSVCNV